MRLNQKWYENGLSRHMWAALRAVQAGEIKQVKPSTTYLGLERRGLIERVGDSWWLITDAGRACLKSGKYEYR